MARLTLLASALVILAAGTAAAQQPIFYPAKGQSAQKQGQDQVECQNWATQQTGVTPGAPAAAPPPTKSGGRARGAAAGAAVAGAAAQRGARRQDRRQAAAQQQQADANFGRAMAACMQGRGYAVQ